MANKHTSKPWRVSKTASGRRIIAAAESRIKIGVVCDKRNCADGDEPYSAESDVADANANLFAASPTMYDALILAREFVAKERANFVDCHSVGGDESTIDEDAIEHLDEIDGVKGAIDYALVLAEQGEKGGAS